MGGWTIRFSNLKVAVNANEIASAEGQGSLQLPMVNEELKLKIGWNPQLGTPGAKWTLSTDGSPPNHTFGRTQLDLGQAAWENQPGGTAKLTFANAKWNLGGVSGAEVKLPLYNLTFTPDGNVTLNGQAWASATGLTNFSLFDYPFPAAEVGVARQEDRRVHPEPARQAATHRSPAPERHGGPGQLLGQGRQRHQDRL